MARDDDYDAALEFSRLSYQSGFYDAIAAEEERSAGANRYLQDAIIAAGNRPEIAGFWRDGGWQDEGEMLVPAEDDTGEVVDLGDDDGEYEIVEEEWE